MKSVIEFVTHGSWVRNVSCENKLFSKKCSNLYVNLDLAYLISMWGRKENSRQTTLSFIASQGMFYKTEVIFSKHNT